MGKTVKDRDDIDEDTAYRLRHMKKTRKIDRMMKSRKGQKMVLRIYDEDEE